jgi:hypothetical protein
MKFTKSKSHWENIIDEWQKGQQSMASFCRERKISKVSFYYWRRKLLLHSNDAKNKLPKADFVPIEVYTDSSSKKTNEEINLYYPNGCYLKLSENSSLRLLRLVNEIMGIAAC